MPVGTIDGDVYPIATNENGQTLWSTVAVAEEKEEVWDDWSLGCGETERVTGRGYYYAEGFDASEQRVLHLSPHYKADNNTSLTTNYGYFCEEAGVSAATLTEQVKEDSTDTVQDDPLLVGATTLNVSDGTLFYALQNITIESEDLRIDSIKGNELTVVRAYNGTAAAEHAQTTAIYYARNSSRLDLGKSLTLRQRVTAGNSDRILIVTVTSSEVDNWGAGVRASGLPMSYIGGIAGTSIKTWGWYLLDPPAGTLEIILTTNITIRASVTASVWHGANQDAPFGTAVTATGTSTDPAVSVTTAAGEWVLFFGGAIDDPTLTDFGTNGVERVDIQYSGVTTHFVGVQDGGDGGVVRE